MLTRTAMNEPRPPRAERVRWRTTAPRSCDHGLSTLAGRAIHPITKANWVFARIESDAESDEGKARVWASFLALGLPVAERLRALAIERAGALAESRGELEVAPLPAEAGGDR